jgi:hypothetical protein
VRAARPGDGDPDHDLRAAEPLSTGLCFTKAEAKDPALLQTCARHLGSRRRYEVVEPVRASSRCGSSWTRSRGRRWQPCQANEDCQPDAAHAANATIGSKGFECLQLNPGEQKRCIQRCETVGNDRVCRPGHVCEDVGTPAMSLPACVESACHPRPVLAPRDPVPGAGGPKLRGPGGAMPRFQTEVEQAPLGPLAAAAPSTAPATCCCRSGSRCRPPTAATSTTARRAPPTPGRTGPPPPLRRGAIPASSSAPTGTRPPPLGVTPGVHVKALFENPEIRFVLTNLEQYVGDGAVISFSVSNGFTPLRVLATGEASFSCGVRIVPRPVDAALLRNELSSDLGFPPYLFVVDQSRTTRLRQPRPGPAHQPAPHHQLSRRAHRLERHQLHLPHPVARGLEPAKGRGAGRILTSRRCDLILHVGLHAYRRGRRGDAPAKGRE